MDFCNNAVKGKGGWRWGRGGGPALPRVEGDVVGSKERGRATVAGSTMGIQTAITIAMARPEDTHTHTRTHTHTHTHTHVYTAFQTHTLADKHTQAQTLSK